MVHIPEFSQTALTKNHMNKKKHAQIPAIYARYLQLNCIRSLLLLQIAKSPGKWRNGIIGLKRAKRDFYWEYVRIKT